LPHDSLNKFVADLSSNFPLSETKWGNLTVLLPSTENAPVPSEGCLLSGDSYKVRADQRTKLATWKVNTLALAPGAALDFLSRLKFILQMGSIWQLFALLDSSFQTIAGIDYAAEFLTGH